MIGSRFDPEQFGETTASPEFGARIAELSRFTLAHSLEDGFAVYWLPGNDGVTISQPDAQAVDGERQSLRSNGTVSSTAEEMIDPFSGKLAVNHTFKASPLIRDRADKLRDDIAMLVHSHPRKTLVPSVADLWVHEALCVQNPDVIGGILTVAAHDPEETARLLFYRRVTSNPDAYFQDMAHVPVEKDTILFLMHRNGYSTATATYNLRTEQLDTPVEEVVSELRGY